MAMETVDALELDIRTRAKDASQEIASLAGSVDSFGKKVSAYLSDMKGLADVLERIAKAMKSVGATRNMQSVAKNIANAAKAAKGQVAAQISKATENAEKKSGEAAVRALVRPTPRGPSSGPGIKQYNPATGKFEPTQFASSREWFQSLDAARAEAEAQGKASEIEALRNEFGGSSDKVKSVIANNHGMSVEELFPKQEEISAAASEAGKLGDEMKTVANEANDAAKATKDVKKETEESDKQAKKLHFDLSNIKGALAGVRDGLKHGILGQLERIARMRALRYIVKSVASALKEGLDNLYQWSKMTNGHFAASMDTAATKLMLIKNSIATALSPAIEALIPLLSTVAGWVNTVANGMSQFFALLSGRDSWTKATEATQEWAAATKTGAKNAKDASKATKDLLADWDELNIIQSKDTDTGSGGGSGSGKNAPNYKDMFDEVYKFDGWIRELVDGINEQFGDIWGLVKRIGAVILGWRISTAFSGVLGTLGALVAGIGLIDLQFNISTLFTNKFLDTGEEGWLIADVLTALMGGVLMNVVLKDVLGGKLAYLGIPIMLTVSTVARTITLLKRTDVSVLTPEALEANALSAIEMGGAAAYLGYLSGASIGRSLAGGSIVAIATFASVIGLKADIRAMQSARIDKEYLTAKAIQSLGLSLTAAALAKFLVPSVTLGQAAAFGGMVGGAVTLTTFGVTMGIVATELVAEKGKITEDALIKDAIASVNLGIGGTLGLKVVSGMFGHGLSWGVSALGGAGAAVVSMGALVGIQATLQAQKSEAITKEVLVDDVISSVLVGLGAVLIAAAAGAGLAGTLVIGGAATVVTLGALVGIQAILTQPEENKIVWGTNRLTSEQIETFVNKELFTVNVPVTVQLIKGVLEPLGKDDWEQIETDAAAMTRSLEVIKLGCASEDTYNNLKTALFGTDGNGGVIGRIKQYASEQSTMLETAFTLIPVLDDNGDVDTKKTAELLNKGKLGWDKVKSEMESIGNQLAEALKGGTEKGLEGYDDETIRNLTEQVQNIKDALQYSETVGGAESNLAAGLAGMDKPSFEEALKLFDQYKDDLTTAYTEIQKAKAESAFRLASYYDFKGEHELAEEARKEGQRYLDNLEKDIEDAVNRASKPGREKVRKALLDMLQGGVGSGNVMSGLLSYRDTSMLPGIINELFTPDGNETEYAKDHAEEMLEALIMDAFPKDGEFIIDAIRKGHLEYGDVVKGEVVNALIDALDVQGDLADRFREFFAKEFGISAPKVVETERPKEELESVQEELQAQADENPVQIPVEVVYDDPDTEDWSLAEQEAQSNVTPYDDPDKEDWHIGEHAPIQEWWDTVRDQSRWDEEEAAYRKMEEFFGSDLAQEIANAAIQFAENGDWWNKEDLPTDVYESLLTDIFGKAVPEEGMTINTAASGLATEATMKNLENVSHEDSTKISGSLPSIISILGRIADSSQQTANKDFTVTVTPSTAWGRQAARSGMMYNMLTGG